MELSKPRILMASDGEKTFVILNGVPAVGTKFSYIADGVDVKYSLDDVRPLNGFTAKEFLDFVETDLGYKLSAE